MIKVNLQNTAVQNMLTGQNTVYLSMAIQSYLSRSRSI